MRLKISFYCLFFAVGCCFSQETQEPHVSSLSLPKGIIKSTVYIAKLEPISDEDGVMLLKLEYTDMARYNLRYFNLSFHRDINRENDDIIKSSNRDSYKTMYGRDIEEADSSVRYVIRGKFDPFLNKCNYFIYDRFGEYRSNDFTSLIGALNFINRIKQTQKYIRKDASQISQEMVDADMVNSGKKNSPQRERSSVGKWVGIGILAAVLQGLLIWSANV